MTMSSRPRVLTEQDAGSMDTLIRRGEQAATAAEQTTQQLQGAAADLEQVKGTIPAAAQSAAALATAQAKATLDAATLNATTAASQATLALATLPKFRSVDVNNPTAPTQAELDANPGGLGGTRLTADGATQLLRWTPHTLAGAWVTVGAPTATAPQVQEARDLAQQADGRAVDAQALAEQADSKADSASNLAGAVRAGVQIAARSALTGTPRAPDELRRIADGSVWEWRAAGSPDGGPAAFGTVLAHAEGGYWHRIYETRSVDFYGAQAIPDGGSPVDSSAAFALALAAAPYGSVIRGSDTNGHYYLSQTWQITRDDIILDISNEIRPMPGMTDALVYATPVADSEKRWGTYTQGNPWQATLKTNQLNINGLHASRGLWLHGRDHINVNGLMIRNTYGFALRVDACREGALYSPRILTCRRGPDHGILELLDTTPGSDANNTMRIYDPHIIHCLGTHVYVATPHVATNNSVSRLWDIYGIQIETVGPSQVALGFGNLDPLPEVPTSEDIVWIKNGDAIAFYGGHVFVDTLTLPAQGGIARGGAVIRLGFDSDAASNNPNAVSNFYAKLNMFVGAGDSGCVLLARHNCDWTEFDPTIIGSNVAGLEWVNGASGGGEHRRRTPYRVVRPPAESAYIAEGAPGATASSAVELLTGTGARAKIFSFAGQVAVQPDTNSGLTYLFGADGTVWAQNGNIGLGAPGFEVRRMLMAPRAAAPDTMQDGVVFLADQSNYNPLGIVRTGPYPVVQSAGALLPMSYVPQASPAGTAAPVSSAPTAAQYNALLDEVRALGAALRAAGILLG